MTPAPRLSIGVPVYNGGSLLSEMLKSLVTQTFTDFEIVISDNASTDDTHCATVRRQG
jgi:glycosyltransferase involved in cell wall biosynthesis